MHRRAWLALTLMPFVARVVAADDLFERIGGVLSRPPLLRAGFTQEKRAAALTRPIVSRGRITIARDLGVIWRIEAPLTMSVAYRGDALVEVDGEGRRRVRPFSDNRAQAEVGRVIRALLAADFGALRQHFDAQGSTDGKRWQVDLVPRSPQLAQFVKSLQLTGGLHVEQIVVVDGGGDTTLIRLRDFETPGALDAEERALLLDR
jgi:hypothetical protein